jgi:Holliday junction resolvase RusA-like endonuclease
MSATLSFTVPGIPRTKGSARAFVPRSWAVRALAAGTQPRAVITNANPKAKQWQALIAARAADAIEQSNLQPFADGGVLVDIWFYFPRPKKYLTKKYADVDVPHTTRVDVDKALRCALDGLTNVVFRDDSMVVDAYVHKRYVRRGDVPRAEITVRAVTFDLPKPVTHPNAPSLFGEEAYHATSPAR